MEWMFCGRRTVSVMTRTKPMMPREGSMTTGRVHRRRSLRRRALKAGLLGVSEDIEASVVQSDIGEAVEEQRVPVATW